MTEQPLSLDEFTIRRDQQWRSPFWSGDVRTVESIEFDSDGRGQGGMTWWVKARDQYGLARKTTLASFLTLYRLDG